SVARELFAFLMPSCDARPPALVVGEAAMLSARTMGRAAMGSALQSAQIIRGLASERGGAPEAALWFGDGKKLPAGDAAQVNAVMSDAAASDDSDLRNIVHCGTPLTAAALALAERTGANGEAVLAAIVLGYELAGRIIDAIPKVRARGFHGSTVAIFAATGAAGRLLRLDAEQMTHAVALAATSTGGLVKAADTSTAREYHAGLATVNGIQAACAAERGYRAEERILEMPLGFFEAFGGEDGAAAAAVALRDLGRSWDIVTDMAVKLVPGGHPYHALAEAAANAARDGNTHPDAVESITGPPPGMTT